MDNLRKRQQLLAELKKLTGISFDIISDTDENEEKVIRTLSALCESYKKNGTKEALLRRYLDGECSENELHAMAEKMHISTDKKRILYLVELDSSDTASAVKLIKQLMISKSDVHVISYGQKQILIIDTAEKTRESDHRLLAESIISMLNTELFLSSRVSYSLPVSDISAITEARSQALYAMTIGGKFTPELQVYSYNHLETGRLMADIKESTAHAYIHEITGHDLTSETRRCFSNEFLQTAECFLKNDLNIAETARQLHVHRNTLLYRLEVIQNETSLDIRHFDDAMKYKLVSLCLAVI